MMKPDIKLLILSFLETIAIFIATALSILLLGGIVYLFFTGIINPWVGVPIIMFLMLWVHVYDDAKYRQSMRNNK